MYTQIHKKRSLFLCSFWLCRDFVSCQLSWCSAGNISYKSHIPTKRRLWNPCHANKTSCIKAPRSLCLFTWAHATKSSMQAKGCQPSLVEELNQLWTETEGQLSELDHTHGLVRSVNPAQPLLWRANGISLPAAIVIEGKTETYTGRCNPIRATMRIKTELQNKLQRQDGGRREFWLVICVKA